MKNKIIKATIFFLILLPQFLSAAMNFAVEESISQSLSRMESLYLAEKWDDAMQVGRGIIKDTPPEDPSSRRAKDLIVLALDRRNKAIMAQKQIAQKNEQIGEAQKLVSEGNEHLAKKNYRRAAANFSRAVRLQASDAQSFFLLGYALLKSDSKQEAYKALQHCLKIDPDHSRALFHISGLSFELKQNNDAELYVIKLIHILDKREAELKEIFLQQREQRLNDKAVATARQINSIKQNLAQATFMRGILAETRGDFKAAAASFSRASKLNPTSAEVWFHYGRALMQRKSYHQATLAIEQSILINETKLRQNRTDARKLLEEGKSDKAVEAELKTRQLQENVARGLYVLSIANSRKNETSIALANVEKALELKPDFIQARNARALLLAERSKFDEALSEMRKVLKSSKPGSESAKRAMRTIKFLMEQSARRDNPALAKEAAKVTVDETKVDKYVKDVPGLGGKQKEVELEDILPSLQEAGRLIQMRNYPEAVRRLLYLRSKHTKVADIHAILGHCYEKMSRIDDAQICYEEAIRLNPNHAEALNNLAYVLANKSQDLEKALQYSQKALSLDGMKAEFHHTMGWVQFKIGEVKKSIMSFTQAIEIKPKYPLAYYNLGLASYIAQLFNQAIDSFDQVLSMDPDHEKALLFKAISLSRTDQAEESLKTLEILRGKLGKDSTLLKVVEDLHARTKLAYERHMPLPVPEIKSPAPIERLMAEADGYRNKGLVTRAKEKYLECQRLAPERFEPHYELGMMYAMSGLNTPALASLDRALQLNPDYYPLQLNKAKILLKLGRRDEAKMHFSKALALEEKDAEPRYYLGLIAYEQQKFESSESYALAALRLKPDFHKAMALLGMARIRLNRLKPARDIYETLYAKAPANSSIRQHARKKIWEITKLMAPAQSPSIENVTEVKNQMVQKIKGDQSQTFTPAPADAKAFEEYGKNTMTTDDKLWVLRQLDRFGKVPSQGPTITIRRKAQTDVSANEREWMLRRLQTYKPDENRYAIPQETKAERFSLEATEKPVERVPDKTDGITLEALELAERGFINQAIEKFEQARKMSPDNLEALLNLGYVQTLNGNFKYAFEAYAQATVSHPDSSLAKLALGNLYWLGGQADQAVEQWKNIKGEFEAISKFNILSRSAKVWQRMLEINPVDIDGHSNLGLVYLFSGDLMKALVEFQAVTKLDASRSEHKFYQAQVYSILFTRSQNRNHLREATKILQSLRREPEPFPHSEKLAVFVSRL